MAVTEDQEFDEAFKGFGDDPAPVTPPTTDPDPATPPAEPPKEDDKPKETPDGDKSNPTPDNPDDTTKPGEEESTPSDSNKPVDPAEKPGDGKETKPTAPETPQPLTKDDIKEVVSDIRNEERTSGQALETTTNEVLEAYYPDGLSNVLIDESSGKELRSPQDVVEASGGEMTTEAAAQWLMNEQYKLDQSVAKIKEDAKSIAETTLKFKQDGVAVLEKYEPLFKAYPQVQQKVWDQYKKLVKADEAKGVILSAPDMADFYDTMLEPYRMAFELGKDKPATNPTAPTTPEPPKPSAEDRMDEGGDGGTTAPDDPNDFPQQVTKELAKGI